MCKLYSYLFRLSLIVTFVLIILLSSPAHSASAQAPRRFYDWSSTLETNKTNVLGIKAFAQEGTPSAKAGIVAPSDPKSYRQFDRYFLVGNLSPTSPFYFMKRVQEGIQLTLTFDQQEKEKMRLSLAGERLAEMEEITKLSKLQELSNIAQDYKNTIEAMADNIEKIDKDKKEIKDLLKTVEEETAKHNIILEEVSVKLPDEAKDMVEQAIEANWNGIDMAADLSDKPAVPPDVIDRLQALKAQGLLTQEEVSKLVSVKTRIEAREELKKYMKEGVLPESDFLRMNENVRNLYKDEFFKMHEVKRFYELKRLENEKPDESTLQKIQEFAKAYKPGDVIPSDIRKYWVPVVRLEEIQNTLRPDLINPELLKSNKKDYDKYTEIVERFKPRPEDIAYVENYVQRNKVSITDLPPEYQRIYNLSQKYGAQCGSGSQWVMVSSLPGGGYCASGNNVQIDIRTLEANLQKKVCSGSMISAKDFNGGCSVFYSDCIPPGWSKVDSCVQTPLATTAEKKIMDCPSNSHFVPVHYIPDGGYCIPNYTPVNQVISGTTTYETSCPAGYHRNYQGGPCLQDYTSSNSTSYYLLPLSQTPGIYPSPLYPTANQCNLGTHWVSDPVRGGYCTPDAGYVNTYINTAACTPPSTTNPCTSDQHFSYASCRCENNTSGATCERVWSCPNGMSWNNNTCDCRTTEGSAVPPANTTSCQPPGSGCGNGSYWDYVSCVCRSNTSYPSSCTYPSGGCGEGKYWDSYSCSCKTSSGTYSGGSSSCPNYTSGMCGSTGWFDTSTCSCKYTSTNSGSTQPPSGYGSCPSGQYWNGSSCITSSTSTTSREQQETTCRSGGGTCSWNGDTCNCQGYNSSGSTSTSTSTSTSMSRDQQEAGCRSCGGTCNWNGDMCNCQCGSSSSSTTTQPTSAPAPTSAPQETQPTTPPQ
ncbi:MAG: hypothetical protein A2857_00135 [Candidatus Levybacteria bacterium RIFCSPHIGHO2_01_FULL_36_15]|nr:MAG: hypothetical protein A2857_00135 [Candidatus Levybacteria bacterium RIFCSPHIGHO2_01_FULL_36_15]OGH38921.1 MAG: hypothetical protein A2905_03740 [Candidatus Levybacteria bacterium RIFCSPLOWO2_01_FULL_36_10]